MIAQPHQPPFARPFASNGWPLWADESPLNDLDDAEDDIDDLPDDLIEAIVETLDERPPMADPGTP